jgi:hypothetical protein
MTYEMWKRGPEQLQRLLFEALNAGLAGQDLPGNWKGADIAGRELLGTHYGWPGFWDP